MLRVRLDLGTLVAARILTCTVLVGAVPIDSYLVILQEKP